LHREDGPAVEHIDGRKEWWFNSKLHREDGPAVEHIDGIKEWWFNGKPHRKDGPALIYSDNKEEEYWICGSEISRTIFSNCHKCTYIADEVSFYRKYLSSITMGIAEIIIDRLEEEFSFLLDKNIASHDI
jgi:hypothetical protein